MFRPQPEASGAAVNMVTIADELVARGHEVFIVSNGSVISARATHISLQLDQRSFWRGLTHVAALVRVMRKHRIQVVHENSLAQMWVSWFATRVAGVPLIRTTDWVEPIHSSGRRFGEGFVKNEPSSAVRADSPFAALVEKCRAADTLNPVVNQLEHAYRSMYVKFYRSEIPVLCYHRLVESDAECGKFATHLRVERFEQQLRYLRDHGYRTLHFSDFNVRQVFEKARRAVILTFDDGYEDNYRLLFPLLKKYRAKAVIYLVSGCEANDWDLLKGEKPLRLMNQSQRREMLASGLVEFGAHTITHSDLREISHEQADREIHQSKVELEASLGVVVHTFAYPYGHLTPLVKERVRHAGYQFGIATNSGPLALHEDPFQVRRIVIFPGTTIRRFGRKVSGGYTFYRTTG